MGQRNREDKMYRGEDETETMMEEEWRSRKVLRDKGEEQEEENPSKKSRRGQYNGQVDWGLGELLEWEVDKEKWLKGGERSAAPFLPHHTYRTNVVI